VHSVLTSPGANDAVYQLSANYTNPNTDTWSHIWKSLKISTITTYERNIDG